MQGVKYTKIDLEKKKAEAEVFLLEGYNANQVGKELECSPLTVKKWF